MGYKYLNFVDLLVTTKTTKINNPRKFLALRYYASIMLNAFNAHYAQNYAGIIGASLLYECFKYAYQGGL